MKITVETGDAAFSRLDDFDFRSEWESLYLGCDFGTPFQHPSYSAHFYQAHQDCFEPLIVTGFDASGGLVAVLPLARSKRDGHIVPPGVGQGRFQTWTALAGEERGFLESLPQALASTRARPARVALGSVPAGLAEVLCRQPLSAVSLVTQPTRIGWLALKHLPDPAADQCEDVTVELVSGAKATEALGTLAAWYDFDEGSQTGRLPFRDGALRLPWFISLSREPELLQGAILRHADEAIAFHIGYPRGTDLYLSLIAHSPRVGDDVASLHRLLLAATLAELGLSRAILPPNDERVARRLVPTDWMVSRAVTCIAATTVPDRRRLQEYRRRPPAGRLRRTFNDISAACAHYFARATELGVRGTLPKLFEKARANLWQRTEFRVYRLRLANLGREPTTAPLDVDNLAQLLAFEPSGSWHDRQQFLKLSRQRLAEGCHVFTEVRAGRLTHYAWLRPQAPQFSESDIDWTCPLPADSAILFDAFTHPADRGQGLQTRSLLYRLHYAARLGSVWGFIVVASDNLASRHVIEKSGFEHVCTVTRSIRLGRRYRSEEWGSPAADAHGACPLDSASSMPGNETHAPVAAAIAAPSPRCGLPHAEQTGPGSMPGLRNPFRDCDTRSHND